MSRKIQNLKERIDKWFVTPDQDKTEQNKIINAITSFLRKSKVLTLQRESLLNAFKHTNSKKKIRNSLFNMLDDAWEIIRWQTPNVSKIKDKITKDLYS